jgi:hypothetical protein
LRFNQPIQSDDFSEENVHQHPGSGVGAVVGKLAKQLKTAGLSS